MSAQATKTVRTPKVVQITVSSSGICSPDPAHVQKNDKIIWLGDAHEMEFAGANPFDKEEGKKFPPNQHHTVGNEPETYTYSVRTSNGTFDPDVVVDPPGP